MHPEGRPQCFSYSLVYLTYYAINAMEAIYAMQYSDKRMCMARCRR